jgi:predicted ATPase
MSRSPTPAVVGRDEELGFVEEFLADVERGPTALVLSGEPGIGKTVLWEAGVEPARERYDHVLIHRSVEAEAMLSFAGLSDLLIEVFDEVAPSLAPLRRRALEVALVLAEPGKEAPDPRALGLALLDVLRVLAQHGPVVVALDDVQWLDASSAGVLQIALRRLRDEPVGVLATLRKMPGVAAPIELERAFPEERFERLWLGPLNLGALRRLLLDRLGLELTRPELARVQRCRAATRSSRSSSGVSCYGRARGWPPARRCEYPRACTSCWAIVSRGFRPAPGTCCSSPRRMHGRQSKWSWRCTGAVR